MNQPTDYPIEPEDQATELNVKELTYAALLDRAAAEKPITEEMIQSACINMDTAQQFPFTEEPLAGRLRPSTAKPTN